MSKEPIVPIVIDTNVLVPSIYKVSHITQFILSGHLVPVWNLFIYDEAFKIALRMWEKHYTKAMEPIQLDETLDLLETVFKLGYSVPEMPENWAPVSIDPKDDPFLWAAAAGKAE